jgi:hypothetical protein
MKFLWKSLNWEPRLYMRADGRRDRQTDMAKLIGGLRDYANAPNIYNNQLYCSKLYTVSLS